MNIEIHRQRIFARFVYSETFRYKKKDWNTAMAVVEKVESIIGSNVCIGAMRDSQVYIGWHYKNAKPPATALSYQKTPPTICPVPASLLPSAPTYKHVNVFYGDKAMAGSRAYEPTKLAALWRALEGFIDWYNNKTITGPGISKKKK